MKKETLDKLKAFYEENEIALGKKCLPENIKNTEDQLKMKIDPDLREFLLNFGGSNLADKEIYGCIEDGNSEFMNQEMTLIKLNQDFREELKEDIDGWFIFGTDGSGNPIGLKNGKVQVYLFDEGEVSILSNSFEEYILNAISDI